VQHSLKHGTPDYLLHERLSVTRHEALAALNSGLAKLRRDPAAVGFCAVSNSRRLAFREKLHSGARPWALSELDPAFNRIMLNEKNYFRSHYQADASVARKRTYSLPVIDETTHMATITLEKLKARAEDAARNHQRVGEHLHNTRVAFDDTDRKLSIVLGAFQKEQAQAIHENRPPDVGSLQKQTAALRTELRARESDLAAAKDALTLSEAAANEAKYELESNRRAAATTAVARMLEEYFEGQIAQSERIGKILGTLGEHGFGAGILVPQDINSLDAVERVYWRARCGVINADAALRAATESSPELKLFRTA